MKCQGKRRDGSLCSYTSETVYMFCQECGTPPDKPLITVLCPGNGGQPCGEPIKCKFRFCPECGWKIDKAIFTKKEEKKCPSCSADVPEGKKFCSNCGKELFSIDDEKDKSQEKEQVADKNANVPETAEPMTVSSTAGIQETSVTAEVENQQQQFPTPSPNVALMPDKHQEKEQISDDANVTETADPTKVSSSTGRQETSVSVENQQQKNHTPSPNVGYVTVLSAQTSLNIKRRNSNETGQNVTETADPTKVSSSTGRRETSVSVENQQQKSLLHHPMWDM